MERHFIIRGSADALTEFASAAAGAGFKVERLKIQAFSVEHIAIECLRLIFSKEGAAIVGSLVLAIRYYLTATPSRSVTITKMEPHQVRTFEARGLTNEQLAKLLPDCRELMVDEGPRNERKSPRKQPRQPLAAMKTSKPQLKDRKQNRKLRSATS